MKIKTTLILMSLRTTDTSIFLEIVRKSSPHNRERTGIRVHMFMGTRVTCTVHVWWIHLYLGLHICTHLNLKNKRPTKKEKENLYDCSTQPTIISVNLQMIGFSVGLKKRTIKLNFHLKFT